LKKQEKMHPSIIFIDELDALVPNRDSSGINHMNTSAVNEFLAQMNNSGDEGVLLLVQQIDLIQLILQF
jgi:transitional endoplasmic reticulum ATPase